MATWRVNNATLLGGEVCAPWQPNHAYSLGARCVCRVAYATTARRAFVYECTTAGTSHATTEPTWPTSGTVADGPDTLVWTCRSPNDGTWDNASCCLWYVLAYSAIAAGDFVYIHNAHSEAINQGAIYQAMKGSATANGPIKIYCVNKADDSLSTGAIVRSTSPNYGFNFYGFVYSYGINYITAKANVIPNTALETNWVFDGGGTTVLTLETNANPIAVGSQNVFTSLILKNAILNFAIVSSLFQHRYGATFKWEGGSLTAANGLTRLFGPFEAGSRVTVTVRDVDLTAVGKAGTPTSLVSLSDANYDVLFERCKIPAVANFAITSGAWSFPNSGKVRLHHCSADNKTYDFYESCYEGTIEDETTIVRTGGASDGVTPQSWKMISSANTVDNINGLVSPPIVGWTDSTTEKTFTVEGIYDSLTNLQDDEIWLEFEYPANNTDGLGGIAKDKCAILGTPADQTASTVDWTTTGITNVNKFKLSVTVTPGKAGPITARVCLAKASTTVYIDPVITES